MILLRWFLTSMLVALATLAYSALVGWAIGLLFPDVVRYHHDLFAHEPVMRLAVRSALEWGVLAALLGGPCLGFTLVRDFNALLAEPQHEKRFWRAILLSSARTFLLVAAIGFSVCGFMALAIWIQGGSREQIGYRSFMGLALGHMAAGLIVAFGHFVRNPPLMHLGSSDDLRLAKDRPSDTR